MSAVETKSGARVRRGRVRGEQAVGLPRLDRGGVGGDARGGGGFVEVRARGEGVPQGTRRGGVRAPREGDVGDGGGGGVEPRGRRNDAARRVRGGRRVAADARAAPGPAPPPPPPPARVPPRRRRGRRRRPAGWKDGGGARTASHATPEPEARARTAAAGRIPNCRDRRRPIPRPYHTLARAHTRARARDEALGINETTREDDIVTNREHRRDVARTKQVRPSFCIRRCDERNRTAVSSRSQKLFRSEVGRTRPSSRATRRFARANISNNTHPLLLLLLHRPYVSASPAPPAFTSASSLYFGAVPICTKSVRHPAARIASENSAARRSAYAYAASAVAASISPT